MMVDNYLKDIADLAKTFQEIGVKDPIGEAKKLALLKQQKVAVDAPPETASFARIKPESQKTYDRLLSTGRYEKAPDGYLQSIASSNIPARVDKKGLNQIITQSNQYGPVTVDQARTMVAPLPERPRTPTPQSALQSITQQPSEAKKYKIDEETGRTIEEYPQPQPTYPSDIINALKHAVNPFNAKNTKQFVKNGKPMTMADFVVMQAGGGLRGQIGETTRKLRNYKIMPDTTSLKTGRSIFDNQERNMPSKIKKTKAAKGLMKLFGNKIDTNFWDKYYKGQMF